METKELLQILETLNSTDSSILSSVKELIDGQVKLNKIVFDLRLENVELKAQLYVLKQRVRVLEIPVTIIDSKN